MKTSHVCLLKICCAAFHLKEHFWSVSEWINMTLAIRRVLPYHLGTYYSMDVNKLFGRTTVVMQ